MIARLLISPSLSARKEEITSILSSHLGRASPKAMPAARGGADRQPREKLIVHPDVMYFKADEKLGIEQARQIKSHFSIKPYSAKGRAVVMEDASKLTIEAQNALLKTLEEPPQGACLILSAASDAALLPTLLSRCQIIRLQSTLHSTPQPTLQPSRLQAKSEVENLLNASIEERFEIIEKLKDRDEFFYILLNYFHKKILEYPQFLKELLQAEQWKKQNVNIRAILEYLMLVMPKK